MVALALMLHIFIGATVAGSAVIAALTLGCDATMPILISAAAGFVASVPLSGVIAAKPRG